MTSIKVNNEETGWVGIPGNTEKVVVHLKNGDTLAMSLVDFLTMGNKKNVVQIDCYSEGEKFQE